MIRCVCQTQRQGRLSSNRLMDGDTVAFIRSGEPSDKHFSRYYDAIDILFHTGLRISEFCGLMISEIEFGKMRIKVDHQLQRTAQIQYVIEEPKIDKDIRYVPMTEAVAACFRRIIANRKTPKVEPMVEGYAGFGFWIKRYADGCPSLGEGSGAYHSEIQQDLPYPDAESYPSCMQAHLML